MNFLSKHGKGLLVVAAGLVLVGCMAGASHSAGPTPTAATGETGLNGKVAVVDFNRLIQAHRDYEHLAILDREIGVMSQRLQDGPVNSAEIQKKAYERLVKEQRKMKAQLEEEGKEAGAELQARSESMRVELQGMAAQMSKEMSGLVATATTEVKEQAHAQGKTQDIVRKDLNARLVSYFNDLKLVRERQLASRRLELQREADIRLSTEKARMDSELAAYGDEISKENQEKKVNLELKKINATNDEERQKIEEEIAAMKSSEVTRKDVKRRELEAQFNPLKDAENAKVEARLKIYQANIDRDASAQLDKEKERLIHEAGLPSSLPTAVANTQSELVTRIKSRQNEMKAAFEARQAELQGQLVAQAQETKAHMLARQKEVEKQFEQVKKKILTETMRTGQQMSDSEKKKMEDIKKELKDIQAQRQRLHDTIESELRQKVADLANREHIPVVLGYYLVNTNCQDLTDKALQMLTR